MPFWVLIWVFRVSIAYSQLGLIRPNPVYISEDWSRARCAQKKCLLCLVDSVTGLEFQVGATRRRKVKAFGTIVIWMYFTSRTSASFGRKSHGGGGIWNGGLWLSRAAPGAAMKKRWKQLLEHLRNYVTQNTKCCSIKTPSLTDVNKMIMKPILHYSKWAVLLVISQGKLILREMNKW